MKHNIIFDDQDGSSGFFIIPESLLFSKKSEFQKIEIFKHDFFGKILRLNGCFQTSELDEFLYHEPLVQYALFSHPNPKKVLIIGGGDGGALKEVIKHKKIKKIDMIELDKDVVEVSKKFLSNINKNSFNDKRVNLQYMDGVDYLKQKENRYDIIILDLTDPSGESLKLYTKEFYELVKSRLNKKGILSLHTESYLFYPKIFGRIIETLKNVYRYVAPHGNDVPLYGGTISFALCSDEINFKRLTKEQINQRLKRSKIKELKHFTPLLFLASLELPNYVLKTLKNKNEIITMQNPLDEGKGGIWEEKWQ